MIFVCRNCGKEFDNYHKRIFCSPECSQEYTFKQTIIKLDTTDDLSIASVRTVRKYLLFKNGNICQICNSVEWNNVMIPLVLDHIDGNSSNWMRANLRMICPNCDALLPTYKARNKGNGRFSRRQRYQEGKSY
jgi:hypothetical protein